MMKITFTSLLILLYLFSSGQTVHSGFKILISNPVNEDLYIWGGNVIVNAPVHGDVIVAGGSVSINDSIDGDILVAGGEVDINGYVGDDVRCTGGKITIASRVDGDLISASGDLHVIAQSSLGSMLVSGGNVQMDGIVRKSITSVSSRFLLNGVVMNDVDLRGGQIVINGRVEGKAVLAASKGISLTENARINRSIKYWLPLHRPILMPSQMKKQQAIYDPLLSITHSKWYLLGASTFLGLIWYLGMVFLVLGVIQFFFSRHFGKGAENFRKRPAKSGIYGIGYFVLVPLVSLLCIATIIGVPIGLLALAFYGVVFLLTNVITSLVIATLVSNISGQQWSFWKMCGSALFVFILLKIITFTPFFGPALQIAINCMAIGSLLIDLPWRLTTNGAQPFKPKKLTYQVTKVQSQ